MSEQTKKQVIEGTQSRDEAILAGVRGGILGVKAGMTQIYDEEGTSVPVTVIDLLPAVVTQVKTQERDGYTAAQVGLKPCKPQRTTRAEKGHFKKSGEAAYGHVTEFRVSAIDGLKEGAVLSVDFLKVGDSVDVSATSKGKGFQGVMKRYNFAGGMKSHGASVCHRSPGSIGNRADPGRVFPGKKMAGHMGARKVTVQNLQVVGIDKESRFLLLRGSVPGPKQGVVKILKAAKVTG